MLEGRNTSELRNMFTELSRVCRLLLCPWAISESDLGRSKKHMTQFCNLHFRVVYEE